MENRIKELREARSWSLEDLAAQVERATGQTTSRQQMHKLETGRTKLNQHWMELLASAFDVTSPEILIVRGAHDVDRRATQKKFGTVVIPELDVNAAAGYGELDPYSDRWDTEQQIGEWHLPSDVLKGQTTSPMEKLAVIRVRGDSMEPIFRPGDRVLVDTYDRLPSPPGIFVVTDGFNLVIKRVEMIANSNPPMMRIKSANPEYEPYEQLYEDNIVKGRVMGNWKWV